MTTYVGSKLRARKAEIAVLLQQSLGKISISVDIWMSSNHLSFLGVVAHFSDASYKQRNILVGFRNLYGNHTGAAQAAVIITVLEGYNITHKLHCFVGDNASNNDSELIKGLNLHPSINLTFNNRIRCAGHIINLIVKATIYGHNVSTFEASLAKAAPMEQFELYKEFGVVGKLHNFVNAVCGSHKCRELFLSVQKQAQLEDSLFNYTTLNLVQDGGVRWHSVYLMILRCLEHKDAIRLFMRRSRDEAAGSITTYSPLYNSLSDDEWDDVAELVAFLKTPYEIKKRLEGNNSSSGFGSPWQILINLQALWAHYSDYRKAPLLYLSSAAKLGYEKLNTYFSRLILDPTVSYYAVATALHPLLRLTWFKTQWKRFPDWYIKS